MSHRSLLKWPVRATFLLSTGLLLMACFESNVNTKPDPGASAFDQPGDPKDSIRKEIDMASLRRSFVFPRDGSIILNIYPLKRSADMNRKDFELAIVGPAPSHSLAILGEKNAQSQFSKEYKWYRNYLKKNKIAEAATPAGYYLKVEEHNVKSKFIISIPVLPSGRSSGYLSALMPCLPDDSCKMPPGPCPCVGLGGFVEQTMKK